MKENIESKNIGNRKFIIELRYEPKVTMLDAKGALVEKIKKQMFFHILIGKLAKVRLLLETKRRKRMLTMLCG